MADISQKPETSVMLDEPTSGQFGPKPEVAVENEALPVPENAVPLEKADAPAQALSAADLAEKNAALEKEQAALLAEMDARADFIMDSKPQKAKAPKQKPDPAKKAPEKKASVKEKSAAKKSPVKKAPAKEKSPPPVEVEQPPEPQDAPRTNEAEQIIHVALADLHPFKNHPFAIRDDEEMRAMVASVKDKGVTQPAIVRSREGGGFEIVSGHRRHMASELAGYTNMPVIVRNLTDEQAITQMVEDNTNQRENILPTERAKALKMQLEAIKHQGARNGNGLGPKENGKRSNEIVAERNKMTIKQVQRYIKLNDLVPDLQKMVDEKRIGFTPAVEFSFIGTKNQRYIAVAIEGNQSSPSLSQAQRMRELDQKHMLNGDVIDGILLEEKKEVDKVILSTQELGQYFGKDKTPREMKDTILKLLEEWKDKQHELPHPEKEKQAEKVM